jgi:hypothetical protein
MTTKEIAELLNKKSTKTILAWIKNNGQKMPIISQKLTDAEKTKKPADFTLDETIQILRAGNVSESLISLLIENANDKGIALSNGKARNELLTEKDIEFISIIVSRTVAETIKSLDNRMSNIENKYEERRSLLPAPKLSDRDNLRQLINTYSNCNSFSYASVWNMLYKEVYYRMNVNLKERAENRNITAIDYADQEGLIPEILSIALEIFK